MTVLSAIVLVFVVVVLIETIVGPRADEIEG